MLEVCRQARRERIGCLNWPDAFPYRPEVDFSICHSGGSLHLHYRVREDAVRAVCAADGERAWEDSCVEFFFAPRGDGVYYNVECTCIGKLYLCRGTERHGREPLDAGLLRGISRRSTLGEEAFGLREGPAAWELSLDIPAATFGLGTFEGLHARGNFYKCGDRLPVPHYLSWAPIRTPKPDFHRPEFFETIDFV
ncbi:MAG: hypothetical protein K5910_06895 [Bacteroidales bacterium]|nr:hypothetical protein [Bacteroidales bacterium]